VNPLFQQLLELYLLPTPIPPGMVSRDVVRKAIEFDRPPRIPFSFINPLQSDFFEIAAVPRFSFLNAPDPQDKVANIWVSKLTEKPMNQGDRYYDEWGVGWEVSGRLWDHAFDHPLRDLLKRRLEPDVAAPRTGMLNRMSGRPEGREVPGRVRPILMFERCTMGLRN
jgi:hypothetical protein